MTTPLIDDNSGAFSEEDMQHVAAIDLTALRSVLPAEQFKVISKLINCISAVVSLNEGRTTQ